MSIATHREQTSVPPILVVGRTGQVATSLRAISGDEISFLCLGRHEGVDVTDTDSLRRALDAHGPDLVVNTVAYASVDRAEAEPDAAFAVNALGPARLARLCAEREIPIIHLSTDYVFDGRKGSPYVEDDPVSPVNVYGASKAEGEAAVWDNAERFVIVRTSWLYGPFGTNFVRSMLSLAQTRDEIAVVADQWGCPTAADDLAAAIRSIASRLRAGSGVFGVFHVAGAEAATWFDFATGIFDIAAASGAPRPRIVPITTAQYGAAAPRPPDSRLGCGKAADVYGLAMPSWHRSLARIVPQALANLETEV